MRSCAAQRADEKARIFLSRPFHGLPLTIGLPGQPSRRAVESEQDMTNDHHPAGRVPLPGRGGPGQGRRENSGDRDSGDWDNSGDWDGPRGARRDGIGHARRMSNWSAAALIVGTGAAVVALARGTIPAAVPAAVPAASAPVAGAPATPAAGAGTPHSRAATAGTPHSRAATAGTAARHRAPTASHPVATTSGSGVTGTAAGQSAPPVSSPVATTSGSGVTITTTNPVTGKKTVTKVRRGGGGDD